MKAWLQQVLILTLLLFTTFLHLWRLPETPPGFWRDEAYNALDALWMLETGSLPVFLIGNTGREPLIHYLEALAIAVLGAAPYTVRLTSALVSLLAIPFMYRWLASFFAGEPERRWLGLIGAAGLAFSFWYLVMSRTAYRAMLMPLFVALTLHLFWQGWQRRSLGYFASAGAALGLSQYTYLSARVLPLIFILFALGRLIFGRSPKGLSLTHILTANRDDIPSNQPRPAINRRATKQRPIKSGLTLTGLLASLMRRCGLARRVSTAPARKCRCRRAAGSGRPLLLSKMWVKIRAKVPLPAFRSEWSGLGVMALVSFIVFLPLGLFFWQHPTAFFSRSADISVVNRAAQAELPLGLAVSHQLLDALRVFYDGGDDPIWRHTLVGYPGFDWLTRLGFWLGLIIAIRHFRRPAYWLLSSSLFVLWLPALLSQVGTLRLSGFLAPYYALMALGLVTATRWLTGQLSRRTASPAGVEALAGSRGRSEGQGVGAKTDQTGVEALAGQSPRLPAEASAPALYWSGLALFTLVLIFSGGLTGYTYFVRWANETGVHDEFRGQLVDLTYHLIERSWTHDLLIPFPVYTHPTARFLLEQEFQEVKTPPLFRPERPAIFVDIPRMVDLAPAATYYAYVWLTRDAAGQGQLYVLRPHQPADLLALSAGGDAVPFRDSHSGRLFANLRPVQTIEPLLGLANREFAQPVAFDWGHEVQLVGYEFKPERVTPGQSPALNLYWQSLVEQPFPYNIFVQLLNSRGEALGQWTDVYLSDQHRWRAGYLTPTQHQLWLDPQARPGAYLVRVGLFDPTTGRRVPIYTANGDPLGDQMALGLFYVVGAGFDPDQPQTPLETHLGRPGQDQLQLLGYSLAPMTPETPALTVRLYWQTRRPLKGNYTIFVQLLDGQGHLVTSWDSQPLAGQYPTSVWQPGPVVVDEFTLPLPERLAPGSYRLVAGMYDLATGQRLPAFRPDGQALAGEMVVLKEVRVR